MSDEPLNPDNDLALRQGRSMRRQMHEMLERQARAIDLVARLGAWMERGFDDIRRERREVRSDLVLRENRVLTAQSDILKVVLRLDAVPDRTVHADPAA